MLNMIRSNRKSTENAAYKLLSDSAEGAMKELRIILFKANQINVWTFGHVQDTFALPIIKS